MMIIHKRVFAVAFYAIFLFGGTVARCDDAGPLADFLNRHQAGIRFGGWSNLGDTPNKLVYDFGGGNLLESDVGDANFYFEGYFAYRLGMTTMIEFSLGVSNRGSATLTNQGETTIGNVVIYPVLVQMKLYPLAGAGGRIQPYLTGGGGVYYGRRSAQISTSGFLTSADEESETDLHYALGGGLDYPISSVIGLDLSAKYTPINFSGGFLEVSNWDGLSVMIGVKYLFRKDKNK
jgi:opacity protein-like surface antigen